MYQSSMWITSLRSVIRNYTFRWHFASKWKKINNIFIQYNIIYCIYIYIYIYIQWWFSSYYVAQNRLHFLVDLSISFDFGIQCVWIVIHSNSHFTAKNARAIQINVLSPTENGQKQRWSCNIGGVCACLSGGMFISYWMFYLHLP